MSILATKDIKRHMYIYLISSIFLLIFGIIYELFSHQVYSLFMILAFLIPLILGYLVSLLFYKNIIKIKPNKLSANLYGSFVLSLSLGSVLKGVLDIYGTTNSLIIVFPILGLFLLILSLLIFVAR